MKLTKIKPLQVPLRSLTHKQRVELMRDLTNNCNYCSKHIENKKNQQRYHEDCSKQVKFLRNREWENRPENEHYMRDYMRKYSKRDYVKKIKNEQKKRRYQEIKSVWNTLSSKEQIEILQKKVRELLR